MVLLAGLLGLAVALVPLSHLGFRDGLQAVLKNFAREQYPRQAGFAPIERQRLGMAH